jgi:hypothetical protein
MILAVCRQKSKEIDIRSIKMVNACKAVLVVCWHLAGALQQGGIGAHLSPPARLVQQFRRCHFVTSHKTYPLISLYSPYSLYLPAFCQTAFSFTRTPAHQTPYTESCSACR